MALAALPGQGLHGEKNVQKKPQPVPAQYQAHLTSSSWQEWKDQKVAELCQKYGDVPPKVWGQLQTFGRTDGEICGTCVHCIFKAGRSAHCVRNSSAAWRTDYPACGLYREEVK